MQKFQKKNVEDRWIVFFWNEISFVKVNYGFHVDLIGGIFFQISLLKFQLKLNQHFRQIFFEETFCFSLLFSYWIN